MAERLLNCSQQSPKAISSLPVLEPSHCDGREEAAARRQGRGWRSLRPWALGVCVASLLVGWPTLGYAQTEHPAANVGTGTFPDGAASNPVTNKIYIANQARASVTVIDGATSTTVATGTTPHSVTVNSVTNKIYVANEGSSTVTVIDGDSNTTASVPIGTGPYAMALNSATNKIYVANEGSGTVTVIDGATNAATTMAAENLPGAVAVNQLTNKIYVVNKCGSDPTCVSAGTVTVIDGATNDTNTVAAGIGSGAVAVNATTNKIYVANSTSNTVTVIDGATNDTTAVEASKPGAMAVNEVTNQIYVVSGGNNLIVIDGVSNATTAVPVGAESAAVTVNPVTNQIYLLNPTRNTVTVIDGATNKTSTVTSGSLPIAAALNPATNQIYVATINGNNVTMIDGVTNKPTPVSVSPAAKPIDSGIPAIDDTTAKSEERPIPPPVNTMIGPIDSPANNAPEFTFTAARGSSGSSSESVNVYFQVDSLQGRWIAATRSGETFTGKPSSALSSGAHMLYAFTAEGQDPSSTGAPRGLVGQIAGKLFTAATSEALAATTLTSLVPSFAAAGGPAFTLTVNGSNFQNSTSTPTGDVTTIVTWNGVQRTTTFVNSSQLTAAILATDIMTPGTATVSFVNETSLPVQPRGPHPFAQPDTTETGVTSLPFTITGPNPVPTLATISPTSATAGGAGFTLNVTGTNFVSNVSVVQWNGTALTTTFVSGTQLTATVPVGDIAAPGSASVTVFNPTPGGGTSSALTFTINAAVSNPAPTLAMISPTSATAGGAAFTLTVTGTGFVSNMSVIKWNGTGLTTTFVSATQLTATVPVGDIAAPGSASVTVFNPTPGGGTSSALTFTINAAASNPAPTLATISPTSATAGGAAFTLMVTGTGFVNNMSVVKWNGVALATAFGSGTQLTATVPVGDIATAGTASVTVFNPTPGGGTSSALTFTINATTSNPVPTLTALQPSSARAGGAGFTLTVTGTNFISTSSVQWNGVALVTTAVSGTQLTATVPMSDIAAAGTASVTVFNFTPGGGTSGALTFTIYGAKDHTPW
jgi:YVTN family beta-propeller protein